MAKHDYIHELEAEHFDPFWDCEPDFDQSDVVTGIYVIDIEEDIPF
jgi:hypothetical protein